jgi:hypothetical protein
MQPDSEVRFKGLEVLLDSVQTNFDPRILKCGTQFILWGWQKKVIF